MAERGEALLSMIYDDVDRAINPDGDDCWHCGGEGVTYDCLDGCCANAEDGCPDCESPCIECRLFAARRAKAVRMEVITMGDTDVAIAWLKAIGRWREGTTAEQVREQLDAERAKLAAVPDTGPKD